MRPQLLVILVAVLLLLVGLVSGVLRLLSLNGLWAQPPLSGLFPHHGLIMVFGFLAVLIVAERYLGARSFQLHPILHLLPFIVALGAVLLIGGWVMGAEVAQGVGGGLMAVGLGLYLYLLWSVGRQAAQPLPFRFMMLGAALGGLAALFSLRTSPIGNMNLSLLMVSLPLFTILGERIELSRFLAPQSYRWASWGLLGAIIASALLLVQNGHIIFFPWALLLAAVVLPVLWADRVVMGARERPLQRYLGPHLALGYFWLLAGLLLVLLWALRPGSLFLFDAALHALAVGFVGTMILGHAPVIAPGLLGCSLLEERVNLLPVILLSAGNFLRVVGDGLLAAGVPIGAVVGLSGLLILTALVAFGVMMLRSLQPA